MSDSTLPRPLQPGDRVVLNAPIGKLQRGMTHGPARLLIENGAEGTVVGAGGPTSVVVAFDDLGGASIGVSMPAKWLMVLEYAKLGVIDQPELARAEHRARHQHLHDALDELVADYIRHTKDCRPSTSSILELMQWSVQQVRMPTEAT